jgi:hypothetical protein
VVTRLVFLVPRAITPWDRQRWGFDTLSKSGIEPMALDLSLVLGGEATSRNAAPITERPASLDEFRRFVVANAPRTVFIDYVRGVSGPDLRSAGVFRALREAGAIYYVVAAGPLPPAPKVPGRRLRALVRPARVLLHLSFVASRALAERFGGYVPPFRVFGPPAPALSAFAARYGIPVDRFVATHSLDVETLLRSTGVADDLLPCCAFVDDGLAGHPDFEAPGRRSANPERYFAALRRTFDRIEAVTGYPVVIARHPRSESLTPDAVGGRTVLFDRTADAIAASVLVLGHASTALGFAALARKPVLLLGGRHVAEAGLTGAVAAMAEALGAPVIDPEDEAALVALEPALDRVPEAQYARFIEQHLHPPGTSDISLWTVVAMHARTDLRARDGVG